MSVSVKLA